MTRTYSVTGNCNGLAVPGLRLTRAEVRAAILGGPNSLGEHVPGGWLWLRCETCGDDHNHCPELTKALA